MFLCYTMATFYTVAALFYMVNFTRKARGLLSSAEFVLIVTSTSVFFRPHTPKFSSQHLLAFPPASFLCPTARKEGGMNADHPVLETMTIMNLTTGLTIMLRPVVEFMMNSFLNSRHQQKPMTTATVRGPFKFALNTFLHLIARATFWYKRRCIFESYQNRVEYDPPPKDASSRIRLRVVLMGIGDEFHLESLGLLAATNLPLDDSTRETNLA